ncbi:MAG: DNA-processing protein DprA [Anaerolineae bacterium]|nr:MAG: DNA-processing protein DprA [Anaerolineae bacterium]
MSEVKYWIGFNIVRGIGPAKFQALLDHFGDLRLAWEATPEALRAAGLDKRALQNLVVTRQKLDLDAQMARLEKAGVQVMTWESPEYPERLRNIYGPPPVLYLRGAFTAADEWAVAVVGTRRATVYGKEAAKQIGSGLARAGVTVVSGLARGIDAVAHQAALDAGGRTVAVLGSGVDVVYPAENRRLMERIIKGGAVLSEYVLGTPPEASNFPPRNRIISGLSLGAVIVEAGARSGALITADYAAEQGRDVFAVPGNMFNRGSLGCNRLIQQGAKLILGVEDILEELNLTMVSQQQELQAIVPENETESLVLNLLSTEPLHVDELVRQTDLSVPEVSSTLALMELKGMVRQVGGMKYVLARESRPAYVVD